MIQFFSHRAFTDQNKMGIGAMLVDVMGSPDKLIRAFLEGQPAHKADQRRVSLDAESFTKGLAPLGRDKSLQIHAVRHQRNPVGRHSQGERLKISLLANHQQMRAGGAADTQFLCGQVHAVDRRYHRGAGQRAGRPAKTWALGK